MNKRLCYCNKCKGKLVSKRTHRRHLLKEQQNKPLIKQKQNTTKKNENEYFDIYLNEPLSISPLPNESIYILDDDITATSHHKKSKISRLIPSIPILKENSINILNSEYEDNDSIISENDTEFDNHIDKESYSNDIVSEYEKLDKYTNINYSLIGNHHNLPILNVNEITKQVILWVYLFQDKFLLPQTASAVLLDFFKELLQSFNRNEFSDFPSTIYRADRLLGVDLTYKNYIVCPQCHQLYSPDVLNGKNQHIKCKCSEIITKMVQTSKGNHLIKVKFKFN